MQADEVPSSSALLFSSSYQKPGSSSSTHPRFIECLFRVYGIFLPCRTCYNKNMISLIKKPDLQARREPMKIRKRILLIVLISSSAPAKYQNNYPVLRLRITIMGLLLLGFCGFVSVRRRTQRNLFGNGNLLPIRRLPGGQRLFFSCLHTKRPQPVIRSH